VTTSVKDALVFSAPLDLMRVKASQFVFLATLALGVPSGFASAKKPATHKSVATSQGHAKPKAGAHEAKLVPAKHTLRKRAKPVVEAPAAHTSKSHKTEPKQVASREKPAPIARRVEPVEPDASADPAPSQEPIEVRHDRKQHFTAGDGASQTEPRKATSHDFLAPFAANAAQAKPAAAPAPESVKHKVVAAETKPVMPVKPVVAVATVAQPEHVPVFTPVLYTKRGRLIVPPAMKGSHEILLRQNEMADRDGLDRIRDDADLDHMREDKLLVPIPTGAGLQSDERLPLNRRYCRPWTAEFLSAMSRAFYAKFHTPLQVNSAVRTVEFQHRLLMTNGNAAPAEGETASPHLTGQAIDLAKHGLTMTQIAWIRGYLLPLVQAGKVDVEEEFQQACFHISVYRKYVPEPAPKREIAGTHAGAGVTLATALR